MSQKAIFARYFKHLAATARQGDAREESFYPALATMLKAVADDSSRPHVHVTTLPKPTEGGNPGFPAVEWIGPHHRLRRGQAADRGTAG